MGRRALPPAAGDRRGEVLARRRRRAGAAAREAGVEWMVCVGTGLETSRQASSSRRATTTCTRPSGCIRTTRRNSTPSGTALVALADDERCVAIGEAGFDLHYEHSPHDEQEVAFRRHIQLAQDGRSPAHDPLAQRVGRHVPRARRRRRAGPHDLPLLHRRSGRGARRARPRLLPVVQRHRVVQDGRRRARGGRARARRSGARRDRQPVPRARPAPRQAERAGLRVDRRCRAARPRVVSTRRRSPG